MSDSEKPDRDNGCEAAKEAGIEGIAKLFAILPNSPCADEARFEDGVTPAHIFTGALFRQAHNEAEDLAEGESTTFQKMMGCDEPESEDSPLQKHVVRPLICNKPESGM